MKNPIALNLTSEWSDTLNYEENRTQRNLIESKEKKNGIHKLINKSLYFALVAALATMLSFIDLLPLWLAVGITIPCLCAACFMGGRVYEECRR